MSQQITFEGQYEYFRCVHHDFNKAYKMVNQYVSELYLLPKKLMDNTAEELNRYISDYKFRKGEKTNDGSYKTIVDFINQMDEFTEETQELYFIHKKHSDKSRMYLKKVEELNEKSEGKIISEYAVEYIGLTNELTQLHESLKKIKSKADEMVDKLERLELRWVNIRQKVCA